LVAAVFTKRGRQGHEAKGKERGGAGQYIKRGRRIYREARKDKAARREGGGKEDAISKERQQDTIEGVQE
jgi:hypothetical protein